MELQNHLNDVSAVWLQYSCKRSLLFLFFTYLSVFLVSSNFIVYVCPSEDVCLFTVVLPSGFAPESSPGTTLFRFSFIQNLKALEKNKQWLEYDQQREAYVRAILARMLRLEKQQNDANQALSQQHNKDHSDGEPEGQRAVGTQYWSKRGQQTVTAMFLRCQHSPGIAHYYRIFSIESIFSISFYMLHVIVSNIFDCVGESVISFFFLNFHLLLLS